MKKLNRKGFTLVELLAVIVILAIVVGIAIPSVSSVIQNAKTKALKTQVEAAADYINDQLAIYIADSASADDTFKAAYGSIFAATGDYGELNHETYPTTTPLMEAMGLNSEDFKSAYICVAPNKKVYIEVTAINPDGNFFVPQHWNDDGTLKDTSATFKKIISAGKATWNASTKTCS